MADHDPLTDLRQLARAGEQAARPLSAQRTRALGDRRRARRQVGLGAAAVALAAVAGGAVLSLTGLGLDGSPEPAQTPRVVTASPQPTRTLTPANLIGPEQVPTYGPERVGIAAPGLGRPTDQSSPCIPNGLSELGATTVLSRNFHYLDPAARGGVGRAPSGAPTPQASKVPPSVYTTALQFADPAAAQRAYDQVVAWRDGCETRLAQRGYTVGNRAATWVPVHGGNRELGRFADLTYTEPGVTSENGVFESLGLTRVADRLMITVTVTSGMDHNRAYDPSGDPANGLSAHEQYALITAAAGRLAR